MWISKKKLKSLEERIEELECETTIRRHTVTGASLLMGMPIWDKRQIKVSEAVTQIMEHLGLEIEMTEAKKREGILVKKPKTKPKK